MLFKLLGTICFCGAAVLLTILGILATFGLLTLNDPAAYGSVRAINKPPEIENKDEAYKQCTQEGGVPAMGFGYTVICLDPNAVSWQR